MPFTRNNVIPAKAGISALKGFFFAALSAICYGTNPLGALHLYAQNYSPETVLFYRFFTAALLLMVVMLSKGSHFKISFREFRALVAFGFLFAASSLTYYASFKYMDAGLASTLLFLYPLEVSVLMAVFFKEKNQGLDGCFYCGFYGGHSPLVPRGRWRNAQHGGMPACVPVVHQLRHLHGDGKSHQLADGFGQDDFLRHLLLPCVFAALFRDARFGPPAGVYAGKFVGLGLYARPCADGALAHFHGEGCKKHRVYSDGNFGSFGTRDGSEHWCTCLW